MATDADARALGLATPESSDLISGGDDAIRQNARVTAQEIVDRRAAVAAALAEAKVADAHTIVQAAELDAKVRDRAEASVAAALSTARAEVSATGAEARAYAEREAAAVAAAARAYTDTAFSAAAPGGATDAAVDAAVERALQAGRIPTAVTAHADALALSRLAVSSALAIPAEAAAHRAAYDDAETFVEGWASTAEWTPGTGVATGGYLVGSTGSSQAGHIHPFPVAAGRRLRLTATLDVPAAPSSATSRFSFVGLSQSTTVAGSATYGIGVDPGTHRPMIWQGTGVGGAGLAYLSETVLPAGEYRVLVSVDAAAVSLALINPAHSVEFRANLPRATFGTIAALAVFQSDPRGIDGIRVGALGAKRASATITPRTLGTSGPITRSYSTSWADLSGWTGTGAQVSAGKLYSAALSQHLHRPLPSTDLSDFTLETALTVPATNGTNALFLVGLQATPSSGNGSGDMLAIGFNSYGTPSVWHGANLGGTGGTNLGSAVAAGTYPVRITVKAGIITLSLFRGDYATPLHTHTVTLATLAKPLSRLVFWPSDDRALSGISAGPYTVTQVTAGTPQVLEGGADSVIWTRHVTGTTSNARIALPRTYDSRKPAPVIIYAHGTNRLGGSAFDDAQVRPYYQALLDAGYIVAAADGAGNAWGSPAAVADYEALINYVRTHYAVTGFLLLSQSMGGPALLNLLRSRNVGGIVAWYGVAPVVNLRYQYDNFTSFAAQMNLAYGIAGDGSDFDAKVGESDTATAEGTEFRGVPMRVITYADDDVVPPSVNAVPLLAKVAPYAPESSYRTIAGTAHIGTPAFDAADTLAFFQRWLPAPA